MVVTPGIEPSHRAYETQVRTTCITMAEGEGFEPPDGFPSSDFKSGALSQTLPALLYGLGGRIRTCDLLNPNQAPYQTRPHPDWHRWKESNPLCRGFGDRRSTIELHRHKLFLKLHYLHGFQSLLLLCSKV